MVTYAACYPGQGAQKPGMALDLYDRSERVRNLFGLASDICGKDLYALLSNGDEQQLQQTENTQLAVTLANRSATLLLQEHGVQLGCHAGFSLGELSAYAAASVISDEELFRIVAERGRLMAKASLTAVGMYGELGMAAVVGIGFDEVSHLLESVGAKNLFCANDNGPKQVVVSGTAGEIAAYTDALKAAGARRIIPLRVSGPFHTPFMAEAEAEFTNFLSAISFSDPQTPLYANVTGELVLHGDEVRGLCSRQLSSPVRWTRTMQSIAEGQGCTRAVEPGPGTVLTGLWRSSGLDVVCKSVGTYEEIEKLLEERQDG